MDTSEYPSISRLSMMQAQLAAQSRRVEEIVDSMMDGIERLLTASAMQDWGAIAQATEELSQMDPDVTNVEIVRQARHVFRELKSPHKVYTGQPRHLPQLLAACRAVRSRPRPKKGHDFS